MSANRGKFAEGKVRDRLKKYKGDRVSFTYNRILDAHSAKGAMSNPQAGDFQWFMSTETTVSGSGIVAIYTRNGLIEIKEVEHTFRLPYKNFSPDQVGRMRIRAMAGCEVLVMVCFRPSELPPYWRSAPLEFFEQRDPSKGSWDMSEIDAYTHCDDILQEYLK